MKRDARAGGAGGVTPAEYNSHRSSSGEPGGELVVPPPELVRIKVRRPRRNRFGSSRTVPSTEFLRIPVTLRI